jgi:hypothetical protein
MRSPLPRLDGLIYASPMVMLDSARRKATVPALARWLLGLGIAATLAANVAHGLGRGPVGAALAAWPAVALVGSYELLMLATLASPGCGGCATTSPQEPRVGRSARLGQRRRPRLRIAVCKSHD